MNTTMTPLTRHPIYRREIARLAFIRPRHGAAAVLIVLTVATLLCALPLALTVETRVIALYAWSAAVYSAVLAVILTQQGLAILLCLSAAILAGLLHYADDQAAEVLRLTAVSPRQVALSRLAAVLGSLRILLVVVVLARLALILLSVSLPDLTTRLFMFVALFIPIPPGSPASVPLIRDLGNTAFMLAEGWLYRLSIVQDRPLGPLWAAYYVAQPVLDAALFGAAGLAAARVRIGQSGAGVVAGGLLWLGGHLAERVLLVALSIMWYAQVDRVRIVDWQSELLNVLSQYGPYPLIAFWPAGIPVIVPGLVEASWFLPAFLVLVLLAKGGLLWLLFRAAAR